MLLYDEFGTPSQAGLDVVAQTGTITLARERFAGLDSSKAGYMEEIRPYVGRRMNIAGIVWTASPMPHPQFVVDSEGGGRALLKMNEAFGGASGLPSCDRALASGRWLLSRKRPPLAGTSQPGSIAARSGLVSDVDHSFNQRPIAMGHGLERQRNRAVKRPQIMERSQRPKGRISSLSE